MILTPPSPTSASSALPAPATKPRLTKSQAVPDARRSTASCSATKPTATPRAVLPDMDEWRAQFVAKGWRPLA
jgi:hypothetical protein